LFCQIAGFSLSWQFNPEAHKEHCAVSLHGSSTRLTLVAALLVLSALACNLRNESSSEVRERDIIANPLVLIVAPVNGSVFASGAQVTIHAIVQNPPTGVARIEFRVDEAVVGEITSPQPETESSLEGSVTWAASSEAGHLITVEGFRPDGSSLGLSDVAIRVVPQPNATLAAGQPSPATSTPDGTAAENVPAQPTAATSVSGRVNTPELNVRTGPGTDYPQVGTLTNGQQVEIVGRNENGSWWAIPYGSGTAWVFSNLVAANGDTSQIPVVAAPQ
jgi:hypothetical protein